MWGVKRTVPLAKSTTLSHRPDSLSTEFLTPFYHGGFVLSLRDEAGFSAAAAWFDSVLVKLILAVLVWLSLHHFVAGIRYLLLDVDLGLSKSSARYSAFAVIGIALVLSVFTIFWVVI